jgi:precorrin-2/cobalt-factor-2 C20-methyltransferase
MSTLIGVGVGPGDPELVTVKAVRVLREADVVFVPVMAGPPGPGRAEATIRAHVPGDRVRPVPFALNDTGGVTARRAAAWQAAAAEVARAFEAGADTVAFGTIGDPNLYSTFSYLAQTVRGLVPGVTIETVPGITALQDLAARAATVLAEGDEPLTLLPLTAGPAPLQDALDRPGTVVGYKLGAAAGPSPAEVVALLTAAGRLDDAVIGARLGLPGQDIRPAKDLAQLPAVPYLSTLIVPAAHRTGVGSSLSPKTPPATDTPPTPPALPDPETS